MALKYALALCIAALMILLTVPAFAAAPASCSKVTVDSVSQPNNLFRIDEVYGNTRKKTTQYEDTVLFKVTNLGSRSVRIKGVLSEGIADKIWNGRSKLPDEIGHLQIGPYSCDGQANLEKSCDIVILPGSWTYIQAKTGVLCNMATYYTPPSVNSVWESANAGVILYYEFTTSYPAPVADGPSAGTSQFRVNLDVQCLDYWICTENPKCYERYSHYGPDCVQGGCTWDEGDKALNMANQSNATSTVQATAKKACPILPTEVDCSASDSSVWYDANGCPYTCRKSYGSAVPASTGTEKSKTATSTGTSDGTRTGTSAGSASATSDGTKPSFGSAPAPASDSDSVADSVANAMVDSDGDIFVKAALVLGVYLEKFRKA